MPPAPPRDGAADASSRGEADATEGEAEAVLQHAIVIEEMDACLFRAKKEGLYRPVTARGVFGGQTVCQSLRAAMMSVPAELRVHSMHGYFILNGSHEHDVVFHVRRLRDGRSFATRSVEARQRDEAIFMAAVQFQRPEVSTGPEVESPMPVVPGPDGLKSTQEILTELSNDPSVTEAKRQLYKVASEQPVRVENRDVPLAERLARSPEPTQYQWRKVVGRLASEPQVHVACLAYMSDMNLALPAYAPYGGFRGNEASMMASLDHSMWFHSQEFRADEWLLFELRCAWAGVSRILTHAKAWTRDGRHVFSCSQELITRHSWKLASRPPPASSL